MSELAGALSWVFKKLVGKIPVLGRYLLGRRYPAALCREKLTLLWKAGSGRFELRPERPNAALSGIELQIHNHLPFDVELTLRRLEARCDSTGFLEGVLNVMLEIPASSQARVLLPEQGLTDRQVSWIASRHRDAAAVAVTVHGSVFSKVTRWEFQADLGSQALYVNI